MVLRRTLRGALVACALSACEPATTALPELSFDGSPDSPHFGTVFARGLNANASRPFAVRVAGVEDAPPILGDYLVEPGGVRFRPRFAFKAGLTYRAELEGRELVFVMPDRSGVALPRVEAVYPSTSDVPENLLRLYVHFSRPMWAKDVHRYVHLYDEEGREVRLPFVEIDSGLWDPEGRRLTLFFHPGRIKRGVGPNVALGPPLREGGAYRLVLDAGLKDARGYELESPFETELRVGPADRRSPDPASWKLTPPPDAKAPVLVDFDEPLDQALALRLVHVEDDAGVAVAGATSVESSETRWAFTPERPWSGGRYRVVVDPEIEDLAGNTPFRRFDRKRGEPGGAGEAVILPFVVSGSPREAGGGPGEFSGPWDDWRPPWSE